MQFNPLRVIIFILVSAGAIWLGRDIYINMPSKDVNIYTGPVGGTFHSIAVQYEKALEQRGYQVKLHPTNDTKELLNRIASSESHNSIGLMVGKIDPAQYQSIRTLATVGTQPLFLFYQKKNGEFQNLSALKGKKIGMPPLDSISAHYALTLLQAYGISPNNTEIKFMPYKSMLSELIQGEFFAAFVMLSADSPDVSTLANNPNLGIFSFDHAKALAGRTADLSSVVIPPGSFDVKDNIPPKQIELLAARMSLVANQIIDKPLLYALLEILDSVHHESGLAHNRDEFPSFAGLTGKPHDSVSNFSKNGTPWLYRVFTPTIAVLIDKYLFVGLAIFLLTEVYRTLVYFYDFLALSAETTALNIIQRANRRRSRGKKQGFVGRSLEKMAVKVIERKSIREKASELINQKPLTH